MLEILEKEDKYLIMLDKEHISEKQLNIIKKYLSILLSDMDFVDDEDQSELELLLESLSDYDKEIIEVK
ncbi:MAG: hypothetical protein GX121_10920 [Ignavibacteria bacterium]|nr:hypothetical protein [Ignavibacteria bacterium]